MKDTTGKKTVIEQINETWNDLDGGAKFSICWLLLVLVAVTVAGFMFPLLGIILLVIVAVLITVGVITYLMEEYF